MDVLAKTVPLLLARDTPAPTPTDAADELLKLLGNPFGSQVYLFFPERWRVCYLFPTNLT